MKIRHIFMALCLLSGATFGQITATAQDAFNPYEAFNRDRHSIYILATYSPLTGDTKPEYLTSVPLPGFNFGYNYMHSINNFYSIGIGGAIGYLNYRISPSDMDQSLYYTDSKIFHLSIPVFVSKYFPFSRRFAMVVKAGLNVNNVLASTDYSIGVIVGDKRLFDVDIDTNPVPQLGILFELGWAYSLRNYNTVSVNFVVNKNFIRTIKMNYECFEDDPDNPQTGSMSSTASSFGISLRYNFKAGKDEEK